jgi:hypothetical protein
MQSTTSNGGHIIIDPNGDVLLDISDHAFSESSATYRVDSDRLRTTSRYFNVLLDSSKFAEGVNLEARLKELKKKYTDLNDVPISELPTISVRGIGRIGKVTSIIALMKDFLSILHNHNAGSAGVTSKMPVSNLANLTIVSDHFDALDTLKQYIRKHSIFMRVTRSDGTPKKSPGPVIWDHALEEAARMRIMVGILLGHQSWVQETEHLIIRGSKLWSPAMEPNTAVPLWWDLPQSVEGAC